MKLSRNISERVKRIRDIGVPKQMSPDEAKYIRLTNESAFGLLMLIIGAVIPAIRFGMLWNIRVIVIFFVLTLLVFRFNATGRFTLARIYILSTFNIYQVIMCVFSSGKIMDHYSFFFSAAGAVVIFSRKETRWMIAMIAMSIICYHATLILYHYFPQPIYPVTHARETVVNTGLLYSYYLGIIFLALILRSGANHAEDRLKEEQERSERLLLNVLPGPIAERLKDDARIIADSFQEATVMFCDLVGFTRMSSGLSPEKLVEILNEIFSAFDEIAARHGLEKIKTIGDGYMVAAGIPLPKQDHAEAVIETALEIRSWLAEFNKRTGISLGIRIGVNTGPLVAGVIGKSKFSYDLWGDTVNTASRMESHGQDGMIHVTRATHDALKAGYEFQERGMMEIKGKGQMETFFLVGRKEG